MKYAMRQNPCPCHPPGGHPVHDRYGLCRGAHCGRVEASGEPIAGADVSPMVGHVGRPRKACTDADWGRRRLRVDGGENDSAAVFYLIAQGGVARAEPVRRQTRDHPDGPRGASHRRA